jgi:S-formylglutathione hydrolase FrmB
MILSEINFFSETLGMRATLGVILPQRPLAEACSGVKPRYRTLYLLHGHSDDHTAWQRWSSIERYVEGMNLAVVMPAVHLSFYTDMAHGGKYWQFISQEVPALACELLPLSHERADTFVAGLSMGGYGAFKLALACPERFAAAASLSGALDIRQVVRAHGEPGDEIWLEQMRSIFGADLSRVAGSDHDLFALAEKVAQGDLRPRLYQCCGREDFLYADNVRFRDHAQTLALELTYEEGPGGHEWAYWDQMIQHVLAWLPKPAGG